MTKEFWTIIEVMESLQVDARFLKELEEEEIICPILDKDPSSKMFTQSEMEKLRLAKLLVHEMGVNLAGVEVVLGMRHNMIEMRKQFDAILEDLAEKIASLTRDSSDFS
jgi:MerR family transcriptional regulator/heat shock protein HspR